MTAKEAYKILISTWDDLKVTKCIEYDTLFVFQVVPKDLKPHVNIDKAFDNLCSVNKKTREVRDFKPFHIPISECKRGKEVGDFK